MRIRTLVLAASASLAMIPEAGAIRSSNEPPIVTAGRAQRARRTVANAPQTRLIASGLPGWTAQLDRDTDVPVRMWGPNAGVPGAVASAAIAEAFARAFLAQHLALLAPGAIAADFVVVANQATNGIRSVGFQQYAGGMLVVGSAIGFAFQSDRLAMVSSTAVPNVRVTGSKSVSRATAFTNAQRWLGTSGYSIRSRDAASLASAPTVIVPFVRPRSARGLEIAFHVAHELAVEDVSKQQRWALWVDATTGAPIARRSTVMRGAGQVLYGAPDRGPQGARSVFPATLATVLAGGTAVTSKLDGSVTFSGTSPVPLQATVDGPLVSVLNTTGENFTDTKSLANGGSVTFANGADEMIDAQLSAFIHANKVKQFAKRVDPGLAYLDQPLPVFVNEGDVCNAYSMGDDIHFLVAGTFEDLQCENTARIADVVYHEFGHSWHIQTIVPGVGAFHPSVSEGLADFTSVLITNDSGLARGFFTDKPNEPLRELDPVGLEKRFPDDATGEPHDEGEILGEALFDLKKALEAKLGVTAGRAAIERIFVNIMKRSVDLPSTYAEALLGDDDDGDLTNGTPNQCEIDTAFGIHGLADPAQTIGLQPPTREGLAFTAAVTTPTTACGSSLSITSVVVDWKVRGTTNQQHTALARTGEVFTGSLPAQPDNTVIQYKVMYTLSNGSTVAFPTGNPAEPLLEMYVGPVRTIACFDFENGAQGWTSNGQWQAGAPLGLGGDPDVAHAGTGVFGLDLDQDGLYTSDQTSFAESPDIDLQGATNVRLQYHRWLGVEDGNFDQARIRVNGTKVWTNVAGDPNAGQFRNHTDREWRFSDLNLAAHTTTGKIKLRFEILPDLFSEFGGWTVDDVCLVEVVGTVAPACGDGVLDQGEICDDGNTLAGDGCSATCQTESGPDGPDGPDGSEEGGDPSPADGSGCCSTSGSPVGSAGLSLLVGLGLLWRRRRRT